MAGFSVESGTFPPLANADPGWCGLPITLERLPADAEVSGAVCIEPSLAVVRAGSGKRWFTTAGRSRELCSAPAMVELYEVGCRIDQARWAGTPGEVIAVQLPAARLNGLLHGDVPPIQLQTRYELFDPTVSNLVNALWNEAVDASPVGRRYVEGLTLALVGLLSERYSATPPKQAARTGKFGARDTERLRAVITEQLSDDLPISRLAASLSMSPYLFAKMFKATFGRPPHAFILEQRIEAATRVLRTQRDRPLAEIANAFGFSSQAHFTEAFRRRTGTTPARWRKDA